MKAYRIAYVVAGIMISFPAGMLFLSGILQPYWWQALVGGATLVMWWSAYWYLGEAKGGAFAISLAVANLFWLLLLLAVAETSMAIGSVGSEGAALLGLFLELLVLLPLCVVVAAGWILLLRSRRASRNVTIDPESSSG